MFSPALYNLTSIIVPGDKKTYRGDKKNLHELQLLKTSIVVDQFGAFFKHHRPKSYLPLDIAIPFRFPVHVIVELRCDL